MIIWQIFYIACIIYTNHACEFCSIATAVYDKTVTIESFATLGKSTLNNNSHVETHVTIGSGNVINSSIMKSFSTVKDGNHFFYSFVGSHSVIGSKNLIESSFLYSQVEIGDETKLTDVTIETSAHIGSNNQIDAGCNIKAHVETENGVKIKKNAIIRFNSKICSNTLIGENCIVDVFSEIGSKVTLENNVFVGIAAHIGSNIHLGEWVVIEPSTLLTGPRKVAKYSVVIRKPTTKYLYSKSAAIKDLDKIQIDVAVKAKRKSSLYKEFDDLLNNMLQLELDFWLKNCNDSGVVPKIVSFYLIAYDGRDKFIEQRQDSINNRLSDHDATEHFSANTTVKLLSEKTRDGFKKLIAIEQDKNRRLRVQGDNLCEFVRKVRIGERKVLVDDSGYSVIYINKTRNSAPEKTPQFPSLLLLSILPLFGLNTHVSFW